MRHVSRTHRVPLDWLCGRIRYIDTKHQLADILTKVNFTRDDWKYLLHLFNLSHFSSICCAQNSSLISCPKAMAKRMQEQKREEIIVAKSKSKVMNLSATFSASSSSAKDTIASKLPVKLIASGKLDARRRRNSKPDAASSPQGRLKDAYLGGLMVKVAVKLAATDKSQESWKFSESWSNHEKEMTVKLVTPRNSGTSENSGAGSRKWPHNFYMSSAVVPHMDEVYSIVRKIHGLSQTVDLNDREHRCMGEKSWTSHFKQQFILVETSWRIYDVPRINSWSLRNSSSKWLRSWSRIGENLQVWPRLITKSVRGDRRVYHVTKLLWLRMPEPTSSPTRCSVWRTWVTNQSKPVRTKLNGFWKIAFSKIWTESMESRWNSSGKYSQESQHWEFLKRFKKLWLNYSVNLSSSKERSSSCQCTTTLYGENEETQKRLRKPCIVANYVRRFPHRRWSFMGPGSEKKGYGTYSDKPDGDWDTTAERMMLNFAESSHPIFRATSALERGEFKSKGKGNMSIHSNGSEENIELNLRTVISANQLSVYGAVADCAKNCPKIPELQRNLMQMKIRNQWKFLQNFLLLILTPTQSCRETCCKSLSVNSSNFVKTRNYRNCALTLVWRLFHTQDWTSVESTIKRLEGTTQKDHEDHIAGKGIYSLNHYSLVHKFIPMPQAMKIPAAEAAGDKEWEKLEKIPAWT